MDGEGGLVSKLGARLERAGERAPLRLPKVLVINDAAVLRDMLRIVLTSHAEDVLTARGLRDGLERIAQNADLALVVCDVTLKDGDGFELLETLRKLEPPKPEVILVTRSADAPTEERAKRLGAIRLLRKPISFRDIAGALLDARGPRDSREPRRRTSGRACLIGPANGGDRAGASELCWDMRDISASGAFIETESALPLGTTLDLSLDFERGVPVRVTGEVVRAQEPSWTRPGGVGIRFLDASSDAQLHLEAHVAEAGDRIW